MTFRHFVFDTLSGCFAICYIRDFLLREVERWREWKHAKLESERLRDKHLEAMLADTAPKEYD